MMAAPDGNRSTAAPLFSVVTVALNSAATIGRTIDSVLAQTYRPIEYLVVDGGSTDGTLDILRNHGDRLRYVSEPDNGIYDAMNKGVRMARGQWIHILNADDYYTDRDVVGRAMEMLDESRTNYFDMYREYGDGQRIRQSFAFRRWKLFVSAYLPHPALVVAQSQYGVVGLYDTRYRIAADHDLILRMLARFPAKHERLPLTVMTQEGVSARNLLVSLNEFRDVTRMHGLPRAAASAIRMAKRLWWGARADVR